MYTGDDDKVPPDSVRVCEPPDPLHALLLRLISNPGGTVAVTLATRFVPDTLKLVEDDAVPDVVLIAEGVPLVAIAGVAVVKLAGLEPLVVKR